MSTSAVSDSFSEAEKSYRERLRTACIVPFLIDRRFTASKDGGGFPPDIAHAYSSVLRAKEPEVQELLRLPNVLVLAEPGAGKSTVTRAGALTLLQTLDSLPVRISLLECNRDRSVQHLINRALDGLTLDPRRKRYYLVDGIDEVPRELLERTSAEIAGLRNDDRTAGILATCRQAFFVANRDRLPSFHSVYHLLDFSIRDIERYLKSRGVNQEAFIAETKRLSFFDEIRNPFNLTHAANMYEKSGRLPATRAELLEFIVRSQLQTRPDISGFRQQRALEQLAIAMEVYARNELTEEEAVSVIRQSVHGITADEARRLLDTLYTTILKRVEGGLSFQLASYGEYLAAESLASEPLARIKQIAFDQGGSPNPSWLNTVSYLAEINAEVRAYFCRWHPLWMMTVSPAALSPSQRDEVVRSTLRTLMSEKLHAFNHPRVRIHRLANLVTEAMKENLMASATSADEVEKGNAIALLGLTGAHEVVEAATQLVNDRGASPQLRYSAVIALQDSHAPDTAIRLLVELQPDDPLHLNIVDVIGTVATLEDLPQVLPTLLRTQGMPSSTYYRFQEMRTRDAALAMLQYAEAHIQDINTIRAEMYFGPAFDVVWEYFDPEFSPLCASLLSQIEIRHVYVDRSGPLPKLLASFNHLQDTQKEELLQDFLLRVDEQVRNDAATFYSLAPFLAGIMTAGTAGWLIAGERTHLIRAIVRWLDGDIRNVLAPHAGGMVEAQDAARDAYLLEERERQEEASFRIAALRDSLLARTELDGALDDFYALTKDHWPPLSEARLEWLRNAVSGRMVELNLLQSIVWRGDMVTFPGELPTLLDIITFYELEIADDRTMVYALTLGTEEVIARYFGRVPMTVDSRLCVLGLIQNPPDPHILDHAVRFVSKLQPVPEEIKEVLVQIAAIDLDRGYPQTMAFSQIAEQQEIPWLLERLSRSDNAGVRFGAETELIRRQHEPTLMAKLEAAIKDPASLGGDRYFPDRDSPEWLSKVRAPFAWTKLAVLRERGLQLELDGVVSVCTDVMLAINRHDAIDVLRRQLKSAPASWRIRQRSLILEQEQQLAIDEARLSPFDSVLTRLRFNTSSTRVKVWCEGINDEEIFRTLLERMSDTPIDVTVGNVHGWPGLQQETDPNAWLAECNEAFIIMDGDNGRNLKRPGKPLTKMARTELEKLKGFPITLVVLQRYGIENYLTQRAVEAVVGRDMSAFFPIPDDVPIRTHFAAAKKTLGWRVRYAVARIFKLEAPSLPSFYPKGKNKDVAKYLQPNDLQGTDLLKAFEQIISSAKRLQGDATASPNV